MATGRDRRLQHDGENAKQKRHGATSHAANGRLKSLDRNEIYDLIPGLVVVMDTNHTILDLNETAARTAGRPKEECLGAKFWDLFDNPGCRANT